MDWVAYWWGRYGCSSPGTKVLPGWVGLNQCDQIARLFFNIWPFATVEFCPWTLNFDKACSTFCHTLYKPTKFCLGLLTLGQSAQISSNLVTLTMINETYELVTTVFVTFQPHFSMAKKHRDRNIHGSLIFSISMKEKCWNVPSFSSLTCSYFP